MGFETHLHSPDFLSILYQNRKSYSKSSKNAQKRARYLVFLSITAHKYKPQRLQRKKEDLTTETQRAQRKKCLIGLTQ